MGVTRLKKGTPVKKLDEAVKAALAGVEIAEHKLTAFQYAIHKLQSNRSRDESLESALRIVWGALYAECMEAYRRVFMWASVVPEKARAEAKKLALERFLHEHASVMSYLHPEGMTPSGWASSEETKFRDEIKSLSGGKA